MCGKKERKKEPFWAKGKHNHVGLSVLLEGVAKQTPGLLNLSECNFRWVFFFLQVLSDFSF